MQIWSLPATARLQPKYFTQHFTDEEKTDKWAKVVASVWADGIKHTREGEGPAPVQSALILYASILGTGKALSRFLEGKKAYACYSDECYNERQATGASVKFSTKGGGEVELSDGDRVYVDPAKKNGAILEVENVGDRAAELVVFDLE